MSLFDVALQVELPSFALDYRLETERATVGVFGPSGAGKTTILETIAGWRRPAGGHVRVAGRTLFDGASRTDVAVRHRGIGYVPQDALLFPHWDVRRNVLAGAARGGGGESGRDWTTIVDVLELGELLDRPIAALSGGERHRVALARALASGPSLLLLDEPLASLDRRLRRRVLGDLVRVRDAFGLPMILISHDPTEVQVLCDHVQRLARGRVFAEGEPDAVLGASSEAEFQNVLRGTVASTSGHTARVRLAGGCEVVTPRDEVEEGAHVTLGLRADDVLVALDPPRGLSARNYVRGRVASVTETEGPIVLEVALEGDGEGALRVRANVTEEARAELALDPGKPVVLVVKTHSFELLAST